MSFGKIKFQKHLTKPILLNFNFFFAGPYKLLNLSIKEHLFLKYLEFFCKFKYKHFLGPILKKSCYLIKESFSFVSTSFEVPY